MKILVRKLSRSTTESEIEDLFRTFGDVTSCDLVTDKKTRTSKGFAFVDMPDEAQAKDAIKGLNNKAVGNSRIRVKAAEE